MLYDEHATAVCSGVYLGGNVVVTAAHCMDPGYFVPAPSCETDADCADLGPYGMELDLECIPSEFLCRAPDERFADGIRTVSFGEDFKDPAGSPFPGGDAFHSQVMPNRVSVAYCKRLTDEIWPDGMVGGPPRELDFAYCVLAGNPRVEAPPALMGCEADEFMRNGDPLVAVGFGTDENDETGVKFSAVGEVTIGSSSTSRTFNTDYSPSQLRKGDSGGPHFVRLPDDTWRVAGVTVTFSLAHSIWTEMAWIAQDPNVDIDGITPCYDPDGTWNPGPNCGGFPIDADKAGGSWSRATIACAKDLYGGSGAVCPEKLEVSAEQRFSAPTETPSRPPLPGSSAAAVPAAQSCSVGADPNPPMSLLSLLLLAGLARRRRLAAILGSAVCIAGCPADDDGGGSASDTDPGNPPPACIPEAPSWPPVGNPDFSGIVSGNPDDSYARVAAGYVHRKTNTTDCCQDFALSVPSRDEVRIEYANLDDNGLGFLTEDFEFAAFPATPEDLVLVDINGDSWNDLVVLQDNQDLAWVLHNASEAMPHYAASVSTASTVSNGSSGTRRLIKGEFDCSPGLEVAMLATGASGSHDKIHVMDASGSGFAAPSQIDLTDGNDPLDLVAADFDGDGDDDFFVANAVGSFTFIENLCSGFTSPSDQPVGFVTSSPDAMIAVGDFCVGAGNDFAVAFATTELVGVKCMTSLGAFPIGQEPHGQTESVGGIADYIWRGPAWLAIPIGLGIDSGSKELFVAHRSSAAAEVNALFRNSCTAGLASVEAGRLGTVVGSANPPISEFQLYYPNAGASANWTGLLYVGNGGLGMVH